jgi:hypothetical protein
MEFVTRCQFEPLPWAGESRNSYFRIGMEKALSVRWQKELNALYRVAQALWTAQA